MGSTGFNLDVPITRMTEAGYRLVAALPVLVLSLLLIWLTWVVGKTTGRVENRFSPALPHQTVRAQLTHTAFRYSSRQGMHICTTYVTSATEGVAPVLNHRAVTAASLAWPWYRASPVVS